MFRFKQLLNPILVGRISREAFRKFHRTTVCRMDITMEPFAELPGKFPKHAAIGEEAFYFLKDGANVFIQGGAATPTILLKHFYKYVVDNDLKNINLYHLPLMGEFPFSNPENSHRFRSNSFFVGKECREQVNLGHADYTPIMLSEIPLVFRTGLVKLDVSLISSTPPDRHGFCSLGPSLDVTRSAIQNSEHIVAQLNDQLPTCRGYASLHISHTTVTMNGSMPCHYLQPAIPNEQQEKIGSIVAENLIPDGATIQAGIGKIPEAILDKLTDHRDLGVHTDFFSDSMVRLVENGVITNACKKIRPGKIVATRVLGTQKVFNFLDDNPMIDLSDASWVSNPTIIAQNPAPVSIGTCIEMDVTGQVACDSIGTNIYTGCGGQIDFLRGAFLSLDGQGKPLLCMNSLSSKGESKVVPHLTEGGGVVMTRAHVHYVVTEYGIVHLFGKNLRQRAHAIISIAHPDHRERLERAAFEILNAMPSAH